MKKTIIALSLLLMGSVCFGITKANTGGTVWSGISSATNVTYTVVGSGTYEALFVDVACNTWTSSFPTVSYNGSNLQVHCQNIGTTFNFWSYVGYPQNTTSANVTITTGVAETTIASSAVFFTGTGLYDLGPNIAAAGNYGKSITQTAASTGLITSGYIVSGYGQSIAVSTVTTSGTLGVMNGVSGKPMTSAIVYMSAPATSWTLACYSNNTTYTAVGPWFISGATATYTFTVTKTITPTFTVTQTITPTYTVTQTITPTYSVTQTITPTYTVTQTITPTYSVTQTITPTL